jgi:hypothetical protein
MMGYNIAYRLQESGCIMRRFLAALAILGMTISAIPTFAAKKPKMIVQVYATDWRLESGVVFVDAYLILPDGTHAKGFCGQAPWDSPCDPESFAPEKRSPGACTDIEKKTRRCVYQESYYADRQGNNIIVYAANGKVTYRIVSSWEVDAISKSR